MQLRQMNGAIAATWILSAGLIGLVGNVTSIRGGAMVLGFGLVPPILMMLNWIRMRGSADHGDRADTHAPATPQRDAVTAEYLSLHKYLDHRFANTVVLTFNEIEDLLGFTLPDLARHQPDWWANADAGSTPSVQSRSWAHAHRIARPNLMARTVTFELAAA